MTQTQLCQRLGRPQSFVSKYEMGERRLDVVELLQVCHGLGITLADFADWFEQSLGRSKSGKTTIAGGRKSK